jgi:pyridoxine kinase
MSGEEAARGAARNAMNILSIQSHVAYGHVGNSAAVFALQRMGVEVWPVHTVQFSNHPGYGGFRGQALDAALVRDVVRGIEERGVLGDCDAVLSGYLGDAATGDAVLDAVERAKRANPAARYCCDPVIGDTERGIYVRDGIPQLLRERALPAADIVTPNHFELDALTGRTSRTLPEILAAIDALHAIGPDVVLVTSVEADDTPQAAVDVIASNGRERYRLRTPRLGIAAHGAGDMLAALFLARLLREGALDAALSLSVASVFGILERTEQAGARELLLIAAQEECERPSHSFVAERL